MRIKCAELLGVRFSNGCWCWGERDCLDGCVIVRLNRSFRYVGVGWTRVFIFIPPFHSICRIISEGTYNLLTFQLSEIGHSFSFPMKQNQKTVAVCNSIGRINNVFSGFAGSQWNIRHQNVSEVELFRVVISVEVFTGERKEVKLQLRYDILKSTGFLTLSPNWTIVSLVILIYKFKLWELARSTPRPIPIQLWDWYNKISALYKST